MCARSMQGIFVLMIKGYGPNAMRKICSDVQDVWTKQKQS